MPILQPRIDQERGYTEADMQIGADVDKSLSTLIGAPDKFIDSGIQEIYKNASRNGYFNEQFTIDDVRSRYDELVNQQREQKFTGGLVTLIKETLQARKRAEREEDREALKGSIAEQENEIADRLIEIAKKDKEYAKKSKRFLSSYPESYVLPDETKKRRDEYLEKGSYPLSITQFILETLGKKKKKDIETMSQSEFDRLQRLPNFVAQEVNKEIEMDRRGFQEGGDAEKEEEEILNFFEWMDKEGREEYQNPSYDPNRSGALSFVDAIQDYRKYKKREEAKKDKRVEKQEGGELDAQMAEIMPDDQMIAEAQAEDFAQEGMVPDEEMEDNYVDFIIGESLSMDDEEYLMATLNEDERLSMIFDQVIETASEFSGSGPVEGPGTGISDSIPARLSDGEFVITAKATEEIGPDELQSMMEQAEMNVDARQMRQVGGYIQEEEEDQSIQAVKTAARPKQTGQGLLPEQLQDRENQKNMMMLNPRNTLLARRP